MLKGKKLSCAAFTLIELLTVICIIAILATLTFPTLQQLRDRSEGILCTGHLQSLHVSFCAYIQDQGHWPQVSTGLDKDASAEQWISELKNYGAPKEVWRCPTFERRYAVDPKQFSDNPRIHYIPTQFDANRMTPFKWPTMPWLIEMGDFHGGGNLIIFPDGSIHGFYNVFRQQTGKAW